MRRKVDERFSDVGVSAEDIESTEELHCAATRNCRLPLNNVPAISSEVLHTPICLLVLPNSTLILIVVVTDNTAIRARFHGDGKVSDTP